MTKKKLLLLGCAIALGSWGQAYAVGYCVGGTADAGLSTSDVDLTIDSTFYNPIDCYGIASGNPTAADINAIPENTALDPLPDDPFYGWDGDFGPELKDDGAGGSQSFAGLDFTLTADVNATSGEWTVTWSDPDIATEPDLTLPTTIDFVAMLKASNEWIAYLFDDVLLTKDPYTGTGNFTVRITNQNGNAQALSHMSLFFRADDSGTPQDDDDDNNVPEPGSMALLGAGLLAAGLGGLRRRRPR